MPFSTALAAALIAALPLPAAAQDAGYAGGAAPGVPANPFASNYPSAPPPRGVVERRERRAVRRPARAPELLPPGRIPR
ncbi:hypothetical protein [uncultured Methylobacterium sp.]|uniref:hypothetical protein n=1 Tax=uncultured Methylobacterium sp. TaxID=157278 RepID=UPI0035CB0837